MKKYAACFFMLLLSAWLFAQETDMPDRSKYKIILDDISKGTVISGTWHVAGNILRQDSTSDLFAKYALPLTQNNVDYLFRLKAQAPGNGRTGYGFHFFASEIKSGTGYGYGKSLLVWITRDPVHYQNNGTYLQLYISENDSTMLEAGSILIGESIHDELDIEAYYNSEHKIVFISINEDLKLFVPAGNFVFSGDSVALRTLGGPVLFKEFSVSIKE